MLTTWSDNAKKALDASPEYFLWWYTAKSVGLVIFLGASLYLLGWERGHRASR